MLGTNSLLSLFFNIFSFCTWRGSPTACWGNKQWDRWRRMSLFNQSFYVHCDEDSEVELDSITSATIVESSKDSRNFLKETSSLSL